MIPTLDTAAELRDTLRNAARNRRLALGLTQQELSERSGVALSSLKRFERLGEVSLSSLLAIAEALDALSDFHTLFPLPEARSLEDVDRQAELPKRAPRRRPR